MCGTTNRPCHTGESSFNHRTNRKVIHERVHSIVQYMPQSMFSCSVQLLLVPSFRCCFSCALLRREALKCLRDATAARVAQCLSTALSLVDESIVHTHHAALSSVLSTASCIGSWHAQCIKTGEFACTTCLVNRRGRKAAITEWLSLTGRSICVAVGLRC